MLWQQDKGTTMKELPSSASRRDCSILYHLAVSFQKSEVRKSRPSRPNNSFIWTFESFHRDDLDGSRNETGCLPLGEELKRARASAGSAKGENVLAACRCFCVGVKSKLEIRRCLKLARSRREARADWSRKVEGIVAQR